MKTSLLAQYKLEFSVENQACLAIENSSKKIFSNFLFCFTNNEYPVWLEDKSKVRPVRGINCLCFLKPLQVFFTSKRLWSFISNFTSRRDLITSNFISIRDLITRPDYQQFEEIFKGRGPWLVVRQKRYTKRPDFQWKWRKLRQQQIEDIRRTIRIQTNFTLAASSSKEHQASL